MVDENWKKLCQEYKMGDVIEGKVVYHAPFGVFLDIDGYDNLKGLIRIVNFTNEEPMNPSKYPPIGTVVKGVIVEFTEEERQVNLSLRKKDIEQYNAQGKDITHYKSWV